MTSKKSKVIFWPFPTLLKLEFDKSPWAQFTNFDKLLLKPFSLGKMGVTFKTCYTKLQLPFFKSVFLRLNHKIKVQEFNKNELKSFIDITVHSRIILRTLQLKENGIFIVLLSTIS